MKNHFSSSRKVLFLLAFSLFFIFLFSFYASASNSLMWNRYGGAESTQLQSFYADSNGIFPNNITITNFSTYGLIVNNSYMAISASGQGKAYPQLLENTFGGVNASILIIPNKNYIEFTDKNLNLLQEVYTGSYVMGQYAVGSFYGNDLTDDVAGIFQSNASDYSYRIYTYNTTSNTISNPVVINFTTTGLDMNESGTAGLSCISDPSNVYRVCASVIQEYNGSNYSNYLYEFFPNGSYYSSYIDFSSNKIAEPVTLVSAIGSITNANDWQIFYHSLDKAVFSYRDGSGLKEFKGQHANSRIFNAKIFQPSSTGGIYRVLTQEVLAGGANGDCSSGVCMDFTLYKLDGSASWNDELYDGGMTSFSYVYNDLAVTGFASDGNRRIYTLMGNGSGTYTSSGLFFYIVNANDGSIVYTHNTSSLRNGGVIALTAGNMDSDITPDFIVTTGGNDTGSGTFASQMFIFNPVTNGTDYFDGSDENLQYCTPTDINFDAQNDLLCSSPTNIKIFSSNFSIQNTIIDSVNLNPNSPINFGTTIQITINSHNPQNDLSYFYADCGNGNVITPQLSNKMNCSYDVVGSYNLTIFAGDVYIVANQGLAGYVNGTTDIQVVLSGGNGNQSNGYFNNNNSAIIGGFIDPLLSIFPPASSLSFAEKIGIAIMIMVFTAILLMFAGSQARSDGIHELMLWIVLFILIVEVIFFTAIQYIPVGFFITLLVLAIAASYFRFKGGGG